MMHHISGMPEYLNDDLDKIQFKTKFMKKFTPFELLNFVKNKTP